MGTLRWIRVYKPVFIFMVLLIPLLASGASAGTLGLVEISNKYIRAFVNVTDDATGRFACDTTFGDPQNPADDNKPLVYGHPKPWTSYTTLRIDEKDFIFGGPTTTRAGRNGDYGKLVVEPQVTKDNSIECAYRMGDISIRQVLSIVKSTTTGLPDTCEIRYVVSNEGDASHNVGLRIMLDTMVGANDGAPFRVRERAIEMDTEYDGGKIPPFWQAFDSLTTPSVTSQGTLSGGGATRPDRLLFTNWGSAADAPWDFDFKSGREFIRAGEYERDSAVVLFFDPRSLAPGESREYVTLYGLGGMSFKPGMLALGVTSPSEVYMDKEGPEPFPVIAYVQNTGEADSISTTVSLVLPPGLKLAPGQSPNRDLGNMVEWETKQVVWDVLPTGEGRPDLAYSVRVSAKNADENSVERSVRVVAPPRLGVELLGPGGFMVKNDAFYPYPLKVRARITNLGGARAYGVRADMGLTSGGLAFADLEKKTRLLGSLEPGESRIVSWQIVPAGGGGRYSYAVAASATNSFETKAKGDVDVPDLQSKVVLRIPARQVTPGDLVTVDVVAMNLGMAREVSFDVAYDREVLELVRISRGTALAPAQDVIWREGEIDSVRGRVRGIYGKGLSMEGLRNGIFDTLAGLHFRVKAPGAGEIRIEGLRVLDKSGKEIPCAVVVGDVDAGS